MRAVSSVRAPTRESPRGRRTDRFGAGRLAHAVRRRLDTAVGHLFSPKHARARMKGQEMNKTRPDCA